MNKYRSRFEARIASNLRKSKCRFQYESVKLKYVIPESVHTYTPDFILPNGIVIEAKGKWDLSGRKKMALVIEQNPELDIRMLFMRDNKINKRSKTKYSDWCDKRGIVYAIGDKVPQGWIDE